MDEIIFTPASVLSLLTEIDELKGKQISFQENANEIVFTIDDTQYTVDTTTATELEVDEYSLDVVSDANEEGYADLADNDDVSFEDADEAVEGGIIKELIKTLAVGGLVRMTANAIKNA